MIGEFCCWRWGYCPARGDLQAAFLSERGALVFAPIPVSGGNLPRSPSYETTIYLDFAPVTLSEAVLTRGRDLCAAAMKLGQEGIMAKLLDGHYAAGRRTGLWKKIKPRPANPAMLDHVA
jgi:hypothetical protein